MFLKTLPLKTALLTGASLVALSLVSLPAAAADLGGARHPPAPEPVEPRTNIERWTGFYLGATLGGNFGGTDVRGDFGANTIDTRGVTGGILAGYNWQLGRMVLGVETDFQLMTLDGSRSNGIDTFKVDIDKMGTFRGRLGYLVTPSMMVYATGGFAWADTDISAVGSSIRFSEYAKGWTAGLGTELMLGQKWTMRFEYLYTDLGDRTLGVAGQTNKFDLDFHTVRAGLTYRF
jgi:outer membrane immunogenic protein